MTERSRFDRRQFLTRGALAAGAMTVAAPFDALLARGPSTFATVEARARTMARCGRRSTRPLDFPC